MNMKRKISVKPWTGLTRQQGAVLVVSLLIMSVMSILGVNAVKKNIVQERMANNYRAGIESLNNAESGIEDALAVINANDLHLDGYSNELDPNGDKNLDDRWTMVLADAGDGVSYNLVMVDDNDGDGDPATDSNEIVTLMVQGIGSNGTVRTISVAIGTEDGGAFVLETAILTEEDLDISGNPNLKGGIRDIHSNSDVTISGNSAVTTSGQVSASGTVTGTVAGGGTTLDSAPSIAIPDLNPGDFEQYVDYKMMSDGKVYDGSDNFLANANGVDYGGFIFDSTAELWTVVKDKPGDLLTGDIYFMGDKGNLNILNSPGSNGNKWFVSIMTDGYLEISGNPYFSNYKDPTDPEGFQNILFLSKTDISISGNYNSDNNIQGIIAAREQIAIDGNPNIAGSVIAGGQDSTSDYVTSNSITGKPNIVFDGLVTPWENPDPGDVVALAWNQLTMAEDAGPFAEDGANWANEQDIVVYKSDGTYQQPVK
jgi:Tfp pilus assembly protein PilX